MPYSDATTVSEVLTNFNGPNFHGILHKASPEETPFFTLISGAQGGPGNGAVQVGDARTFEWQTAALRTPSATRQLVDAADAPSPQNRKRLNVYNVIQTHTDTYEVGFERMAQTGQFDGQNVNQGPNPVTDELGWQGRQRMVEQKLDMELSLLYSTRHVPSDNQTPARTGGLDEAITTNVLAADGANLGWDLCVTALKAVVDVGGPIGEGKVLMANSDQIAQISAELATKNLAPRDRTIYGVNVQTVVTPFGNLNILFNRHVNQGEAFVISPDHFRLWSRFITPHEDIPGGISFSYTLGREGNRTTKALYNSIGLEYGLEKAHAKITGLAVTDASAS